MTEPTPIREWLASKGADRLLLKFAGIHINDARNRRQRMKQPHNRYADWGRRLKVMTRENERDTVTAHSLLVTAAIRLGFRFRKIDYPGDTKPVLYEAIYDGRGVMMESEWLAMVAIIEDCITRPDLKPTPPPDSP